ncbi:MAG: hypothetical protein LAT64_09545 [Phycisphaerales bacterium]|nr:hypothetical protein [Planctomycetota bacterium]MCH8508991.1 hypothetical protein [Phycisphaerales bacterium]
MQTIAERLSTYRLNVGASRIVWNLFVLVLLAYLITAMGTPTAKLLFAGLILCGLISGMVLIPIAPRNPPLASRLVDAAWWIAVLFLVLNFTRINPAPLLGTFGIIFFVMFGLSGSFWLHSTPGLLSSEGHKRLNDRLEHEENLRRIAQGEDDVPEPEHAGSPRV